MSIPVALLDQILGRLSVRYGQQWAYLWEGVLPEHVRADWASVLRNVDPAGVAYALDNLPEKPPNASQFVALCRRAPAAPVLLIAPPPGVPCPPELRDRIRNGIAPIAGRSVPNPADALRWAANLRAREEAGEHLSPTQRAAWRAAFRPQLVAEEPSE